jgi:hypothetical protein
MIDSIKDDDITKESSPVIVLEAVDPVIKYHQSSTLNGDDAKEEKLKVICLGCSFCFFSYLM